MVIPIKINCGCGQRYAFEIEPVGGLMPTAIACPTCGADGMAAANDVITQNAAAAPVAKVRVRVATPPAIPAAPDASAQTAEADTGAPPTAELDLTRAVSEARSKIMWGDTAQQAIVALMAHGIGHGEASQMVTAILKERAAMVRANGIRKIFVGSGLILVPIVSLVVFLWIGFIPFKLFAITVMVGLYGAYTVMKGVFMTLAPKAEPGDVADH